MRYTILLLSVLLTGCIRAHVHKVPELLRLKNCEERFRTSTSVWLECNGKQMVELRLKNGK